MNLSFFIARRIARNRSSGFSGFIIRLATIATAVSVALMIISVAVVSGFKDTIKDKLFVFWGQIQVTPFNPNPSTFVNPQPFDYDPALSQEIASVKGVTSVQPYAVKPAILHASSGIIEGIRLKGVTANYPMTSNNIINFKGHSINFKNKKYSRGVILSQKLVNRLDTHIGDTLMTFFINPNQKFPSIRRLVVAGTYHTGMSNIDGNFALCDIRLIRHVGHWDKKAINGYQVAVADYKQADKIGYKIYKKYLSPPLYTNSMADLYPAIYNWLGLLNKNAYIILAIMAIVSVINLSTALLIFILERTNMTGILMSLGMPIKKLQNIFLYHATIIALKGIIYGTIAGIAFCLVQKYFPFIHLNESSYYMKNMPVLIKDWQVILVDVGTLIFCLLIMIIPSLFVRRINLIKAIRFR